MKGQHVRLDITPASCNMSPMVTHVLIVDDDPKIRDIIRIALEAAGMRTTEASNGEIALTHVAREKVDLVVLDIGMPNMDGFDCCKAIRARSDVPVLFLTARDDEIDRVLGFQLGADDFVPKPFSPRELVLRIKAILSRVHAASRPHNHGQLSLDSAGHVCRISDHTLDLTATEFQLLASLLARPDHVHDRNQLIQAIYGANSTMSGRTIDSHVRNVRAKAATVGCDDIIVTVHGVGIKLGPCSL
ncbi:response regulator transcription factor [Aliiroseovarius crassostreae]|nr:response regulator transcription factor [Aliiroseovarius crassostreae]